MVMERRLGQKVVVSEGTWSSIPEKAKWRCLIWGPYSWEEKEEGGRER